MGLAGVVSGQPYEPMPPGMNTDQTIGWMAGVLSAVQRDVEQIVRTHGDHETRLRSLESTRDTQRGAATFGRFLMALPVGVLGAVAGFFGGKSS